MRYQPSRILIAGFAVLTAALGGERELNVLSAKEESLCSIFSVLPQLAGRVVTIRAELHAGDEQFFIASRLCSDRLNFLG